jgi:hypothetical protein
MKKIDLVSYLPQNNIRFQQEELDSKGTLIFSGINHYALEPNTIMSGVSSGQSIISLDFQNKDIVIGNDKHILQIEKDRINSKISFLQTAQEKSLKIRFGTLETFDGGFFTDAFNLTYRTGNLNLDVRPKVNGVPVLLSGEVSNEAVLVTGTQTISGTKIFADNISVSGTGIFNAIDLNNIDNINLSGIDISITDSNISLLGTSNIPTLADIFPASSTPRRYRPLGVSAMTTTTPVYQNIQYFPFLIKKDAINPQIAIELVGPLLGSFPIRYGIYSGEKGFEGAKLFYSGSINANATGIFNATINLTLKKGPYIIATSNTGVVSPSTTFRAVSSNHFGETLGEPTGNTSFFSGISTVYYYETGVDLNPVIGPGFLTSTNKAPMPCIVY